MQYNPHHPPPDDLRAMPKGGPVATARAARLALVSMLVLSAVGSPPPAGTPRAARGAFHLLLLPRRGAGTIYCTGPAPRSCGPSSEPERGVVQAVCASEDAVAGRGRRLTPPPAKEAAGRLGLPVLQPERLGRGLELGAPTIVVVAYGLLVPEDLLAGRLWLNVHPSLLPRWRGATPVERAIMAGDSRTGVTIHRTVEKLDAAVVLEDPGLIHPVELVHRERTPGRLNCHLVSPPVIVATSGSSVRRRMVGKIASGSDTPVQREPSWNMCQLLPSRTACALLTPGS